LETMVSTNDGFEIAEVDLQLRGPGDIEGAQQSGLPFDLKIASLSKDSQILQFVRQIAMDILDEDPDLNHPKNQLLNIQLQNANKEKITFSQIS